MIRIRFYFLQFEFLLCFLAFGIIGQEITYWFLYGSVFKLLYIYIIQNFKQLFLSFSFSDIINQNDPLISFSSTPNPESPLPYPLIL